MRTLVVEHLVHPRVDQLREVAALEVPAAAVEREPVHQHDGDVGLATVSRVDLLDGDRHTVVRGHGRLAIGPQLS